LTTSKLYQTLAFSLLLKYRCIFGDLLTQMLCYWPWYIIGEIQ